MKKKIHKLAVIPPAPFNLAGISSHENDYRLSWAINRKMGLNFQKTDNFKVPAEKKHDAMEFTAFQHLNEELFIKINLISNRCQNGFLIKELKNIDFFLQIFGDFHTRSMKTLISEIRKIEIVSAVFEISPSEFKKNWKLPLE